MHETIKSQAGRQAAGNKQIRSAFTLSLPAASTPSLSFSAFLLLDLASIIISGGFRECPYVLFIPARRRLVSCDMYGITSFTVAKQFYHVLLQFDQVEHLQEF